MKKLLAILLAALMLVSVSACAAEVENSDISAVNLTQNKIDDSFSVATGTFKYEYIDSVSIRITGYEGQNTVHDLVIPTVMNDKTVAEIGAGAFDYCSNLSSVTIPNTVTAIGNEAFAFCGSLTNVTLPASITSMGNSTFAFCDALEKVTFTATENAKLTAIGQSAFHGCTMLSEINIPASVTEIAKGSFFKCASLEQLILPANVAKICEQAFASCTGLSTVILPASLTTCEAYAFAACTGLEVISFADVANWTSVPTDGDAEAETVDVSDFESAYDALVKDYQNDLVKVSA